LKSKLLLSTLCLLLCSCATTATDTITQTGNNFIIDEFRGHKWGSRLETFGEMEQFDSEYHIYKKPNEDLTMGGVEVESAVYFFENDQFNMAQVVFNSEESFTRLIKVLESRYGRGVKKNYPDPRGNEFYEANVGRKSPERNRYWWVLEEQKLSLYIEYREEYEKGQVMYFYELPGAYEKGVEAFERQDYEEAFEYFTNASDGSNAKSHGAEGFLGYMHEMGLGVEKDLEQAFKWYRQASTVLEGASTFAQFRLGLMYQTGSGVERDFERSVSWYRKAAERNFSFAQYHLGMMYKNGLGVEKDYDEALDWFRKAVESDGSYTEPYYFAARILKAKKQYDEALKNYDQAIKIDPNQDQLYLERGEVHRLKNSYHSAISDFTKAGEINPGNYKAYNLKAWILATCPIPKCRDGDKAIRLAKKAVEMSPTPYNLDTLAAAYAEAGMFEKAVTTQEEAISILRQEGKPDEVIEGFKMRLVSYKEHKPWRE